MRILPASGKLELPPRLDIRGLILMALGHARCSTYGLAEIGILDTFTSPRVVIPVIVGVLLLVAFCWHAWGAKNPLLDLHLYRRGTYAAASLVMFFLGAALFGAIILLPLYYQNLRHAGCDRHRPAAGPAGHRHGVRDAVRRPPHRPRRRRPARAVRVSA